MRLAAYHDSTGNIVGLALSPSADAVLAEVVVEKHPGLRMTDVKVPSGVRLNFNDPPRLNEELDKLVKNYRVDKGSLTRKS
jgi:hypothetical protein